MEGNKIIPGASSINFDEISKKRIYDSINNSSFSKVALFKEKYNQLKYKLGRIPSLYDFAIKGEFNPEIILNHNKFDTYHTFLEYVEDGYSSQLSEAELAPLRFITKKLIKGIRPHELVILSCLLYNKCFTINQVERYLYETYGLEDQFESIKSAVNVLSMNFYRKETSDDYQANTIQFITDDDIDIERLYFNFDKDVYDDLKSNGDYRFEMSDSFRAATANPVCLNHIRDAIRYGFYKYANVYGDEKPFKWYEKYSREDVLRLLNWERFMNGQNIGGYKIKYDTCPIFVTYNKAEDISQTINYEDHFITKDTFNWMSRNNRKTSSPELEPLINYNGVNTQLYIKKSNDEGIEFYYIGKLTPLKYKQVYRNINGKDQPISAVRGTGLSFSSGRVTYNEVSETADMHWVISGLHTDHLLMIVGPRDTETHAGRSFRHLYERIHMPETDFSTMLLFPECKNIKGKEEATLRTERDFLKMLRM